MMIDRNQVFKKNVLKSLASDNSGETALELFEAIIQIQGHELGISRAVIHHLATLCYPPATGTTSITYEAAVRRALKENTLDEAHSVLRMALWMNERYSKAGRKGDRRPDAIKVLIYKIFLGLSQTEATDRVCRCRQHPHQADSTCLDSLKSIGKTVTAELRQYGIDLKREKGRF